MTLSTSRLLFFLLLALHVLVVLGSDVIVPMNSPLLVWSVVEPNPRPTTCGGKGELQAAGESVSLPFSGTGFAVNLLGDWKGDSAEISLDGNVVATMATNVSTSVYSVCDPITYNFGPFADGQHTLTVTQRIIGGDYNVGNVFLSSFSYTPSGSTPSITNLATNTYVSSSPDATASNGSSVSGASTDHKSRGGKLPIIIGIIAGVVVLAILGLLAWLLLRNRRRHAFNRGQNTDLNEPYQSAWPKETYNSPGLTSTNFGTTGNTSPPHTHLNMGYEATPFVLPPRNVQSPSQTQITAQSPAQSQYTFQSSAQQYPPSPPQSSTGLRDVKVPLLANTGTGGSPRPESISGSSMSIPMSNRLTPAQLETVRGLMAAGVTGNDLTVLVKSMVEGENAAGPSQPGLALHDGDAPPPMYDFKDASRR